MDHMLALSRTLQEELLQKTLEKQNQSQENNFDNKSFNV